MMIAMTDNKLVGHAPKVDIQIKQQDKLIGFLVVLAKQSRKLRTGHYVSKISKTKVVWLLP